MDLVLESFGEKVAAAAPLLRPDLVKTALVHPSMQQASETMTRPKWKQTLKDVPLAALAGGLGYGIGRTLAEVIGENVAASGGRPAWMNALPIATAVISAGGAYAAGRAREGMKTRREQA